MGKINAFNLRVYGILVQDEAILLLHENYAGKPLVKFPGCGIEFGEGIIDTLKREFKEELNLEVTFNKHFYTQDFFVPSAFRENEQIQTFYYFVEVEDISQIQKLDEGIQECIWMKFSELKDFTFPLPVDEIVRKKLVQKFLKRND